jgi:hypothetical protein
VKLWVALHTLVDGKATWWPCLCMGWGDRRGGGRGTTTQLLQFTISGEVRSVFVLNPCPHGWVRHGMRATWHGCQARNGTNTVWIHALIISCLIFFEISTVYDTTYFNITQHGTIQHKFRTLSEVRLVEINYAIHRIGSSGHVMTSVCVYKFCEESFPLV